MNNVKGDVLVETKDCIRRQVGLSTKIVSRVGERFGKLVILEELGGGKVLVDCDCGTRKGVVKGKLVIGNTKSCGCLKTEYILKARRSRG